MPATKSMLCRYQIINMCLSSKVKRYWSQQELISKLSDNDILVSRRTLMNDIDAMRYDDRLGYKAPIVFSKSNKGFYYDQDDYSINQLNLTEEDIETLLIASALIKPFDTLGCVKNLSGVIQKIVSNTSVSMLHGAKLPDLLIGSKVPIEQSENISLLLQAVHEKNIVKIILKSVAEGQERERFFFRPHHLHQHGDTWYLAGVSEPQMDVEFIQLDLIDGVLMTSRYFEITVSESR